MNSQVLSVENGELKTENAPIIPVITASNIDAAKVRSAEDCPSGGNLLLVLCVLVLIFKVFFIDRKKNTERDDEISSLRINARYAAESAYTQRKDVEHLQEIVANLREDVDHNQYIVNQRFEKNTCNCVEQQNNKKHKKNK